jgi:hypothetical protein
MSYRTVDPQSISDAYREVNRTEAEAERWKRQTCEVLGKSEAFRAVLLAVQIWSERQIASGVSAEEAGIALLGGVMASGFQLGLLVGERATAARGVEIAGSEPLNSEGRDPGASCGACEACIRLSIQDAFKKEFNL